MNMATAVKVCLLEKYATFSGRASRPEYWWFALAYVIGAVIVSLLSIRFLYVIYTLALIVPAAAVGYRRLQDTGRNGWLIFIPIGLGLISLFLAPSAPVMQDGQVTQMPDMGGMGLLAAFSIVQLIVGLVFLWWLTRPSQPEGTQ
ncbi:MULTISPECIES: DUF805 domain-containing protein [Roseobacteraceae]|uniref:Inner membrane protein YhaI n=1 Tax=Pseudosulfitobacter pseudonitzschiae TaxID=1402135 RepID=A0A221K568_9RHOB|nr:MULTISPECIES: DUF805 domain-containing protein [Roseobacteraceae]ASM74132.1 inner membrane protein YhaI [Pseudosulfitobacter pseudonitzschiae]